MLRLLCLMLLAVLLIGCGSAAPSVQPTPMPDADAPQTNGPDQRIDEVLWPEPGTTVYAEGDRILTRAYAPLTLNGRTVYPVLMGVRVYLFRQEGDAVYIDGHVRNAGTVEVYEEPRLLWRFPLTPGTSFDLQFEHHNFGSTPRPVQVAAVEELSTPAGTFRGIRLEADWVAGGFWAVRTGLVTPEATRVEVGEPQPLPAIRRLSDGTTAILTGGFQVVDLADGSVLLDRPIVWIRSRVWWADVGA